MLGEFAWAMTPPIPFTAAPNSGYNLIPHLRAGQVVIVADSRTGQPTPGYARVTCLPLHIADATIERGWEGQPRPNIPEYRLLAEVNHQEIVARVFFPTQAPSERELALAQAELARLRIPARPKRQSKSAKPVRLDRPLHLPRFPASGRCPRTSGGTRAKAVAIALGQRPVYPVLGMSAAPPLRGGVAGLRSDFHVLGWCLHKTLWAISPRYQEVVS